MCRSGTSAPVLTATDPNQNSEHFRDRLIRSAPRGWACRSGTSALGPTAANPEKNTEDPLRQADADRTVKASLAVRTRLKNVFEETLLGPAHGALAFSDILPRAVGPIFRGTGFYTRL